MCYPTVTFPDIAKVLSGERTVLHFVDLQMSVLNDHLLAFSNDALDVGHLCRVLSVEAVHLLDDVTPEVALQCGASSVGEYLACWDVVHPVHLVRTNPIVFRYTILCYVPPIIITRDENLMMYQDVHQFVRARVNEILRHHLLLWGRL